MFVRVTDDVLINIDTVETVRIEPYSADKVDLKVFYVSGATAKYRIPEKTAKKFMSNFARIDQL